MFYEVQTVFSTPLFLKNRSTEFERTRVLVHIEDESYTFYLFSIRRIPVSWKLEGFVNSTQFIFVVFLVTSSSQGLVFVWLTKAFWCSSIWSAWNRESKLLMSYCFKDFYKGFVKPHLIFLLQTSDSTGKSCCN